MAREGGGIVVLTTKISKCKCSVCVQFVCAEISPISFHFIVLLKLIEHYCTGLEAGASLNYYRYLLLARFRVFGKPKWMRYRLILQIFYAQLIQDLLQRKKQGTLKNGTFLQIALNISLDVGCFRFRDGQILKNMSKEL